MLQAHHRIAMPPETRFVLPTYLERADFGDLADPANRGRLADMIIGTFRFDDLGLDHDMVKRRIIAEAPTVGAAAGVVLRSYADRHGKVRWGDKRPNYRNNMWVVQRLFPDAQFVHLLRDGRDCVASMTHMPPWDSRALNKRIEVWMEAVEHAKLAQQTMPADTFYQLQYEHLVAQPREELERLCAFLGEEFDEAMLKPEAVASQVVPERETWHANTHNPVSARSVGGYRTRLEPDDLAICESVMGEHLRELGYEPSGSPEPDPAAIEKFRRRYAKKQGFLRDRRRDDDAVCYPWPVADMSESEALLHREVRRLKAQLRNRKRSQAEAEAELEAMRQSRSWRWTRLLRNRAVGRLGRD